VKISQKSHEFLFGCNIFVLGQMKERNEAYEEAFLKLFNFATAAFYWTISNQSRAGRGLPREARTSGGGPHRIGPSPSPRSTD